MLAIGGLKSIAAGGGSASFSGAVTAASFTTTSLAAINLSGNPSRITWTTAGRYIDVNEGTGELRLNSLLLSVPGDVTLTAGRVVSRSATGGFTFGSAGTEYFGMAAGASVINSWGGGQIYQYPGTQVTTGAAVGGSLSVITTAVGNVGAGTDDLMTFSIPANSLVTTNRGVRIRAWGTTTNNANAKTVTLNFGSQTIMTQALTTGLAGTWRIDATCIRTGSNTQDCFAELLQLSTIIHKQTLTAGTQTESGAIIVKCTGTATTDNDIVQEGFIVELI